jgi:hypothetical protein
VQSNQLQKQFRVFSGANKIFHQINFAITKLFSEIVAGIKFSTTREHQCIQHHSARKTRIAHRRTQTNATERTQPNERAANAAANAAKRKVQTERTQFG